MSKKRGHNFKAIAIKTDEIIKLMTEDDLRMINGKLHNGWAYKFSISQKNWIKMQQDKKRI